MLVMPSGSGSNYNISRSLRFRAANSAYLYRTPATATNRTTWTWSGWVKRGALGGTYRMMFGAIPTGGAYTLLGFGPSDNILVWEYPTVAATVLTTTAAYRDPAAFLHVVLQYNTPHATAASRIKLYVNGTEITAFSVDSRASITQNLNGMINNNVQHIMSSEAPTENNYYFDGVMAEVNFVDGQALTPSSFGQFDSITGVWSAKKYAGTYGTNGFYLPFSDNTSLTAASNTGLGKDFSGNTNYWIVSGFSITTGPTYDSFTDVPTLTSTTAGNYATLNPLNLPAAGVTLSDGNLKMTTGTNGVNCRALSTIGMTTGKWYCEYQALDASTLHVIGIAIDTDSPSAGYIGATTGSYGYYALNGTKFNVSNTAYGATWNQAHVMGIAFDATAGTLEFFKDGVSQGVAYTGIPAGTYYFGQGDYSASYSGAFNFGQRPWANTPPTGYLALNTFNLPDSTIKAGNKYFDIALRNGFGTAGGAITSLQFQPDLMWDKGRNTISDNQIMDSVRGITKYLISSTTAVENTAANWLGAFTSNGVTFNVTGGDYAGGVTVVDWFWKKGATPGFDIVTYTGNSAVPKTVSHSLGVAPKFMIIKGRDAVTNWAVYHQSLANTEHLYLSLTNAKVTSSAYWNSTTPTSSAFSIGAAGDTNNGSSLYVAYLWSEVYGFSKFGKYVGNGAADGPFVYCGFRPRYILIKNTANAAANWLILDTARSSHNTTDLKLATNLSAIENDAGIGGTGVNSLDILSNGFKLKSTGGSSNENGSTHIYAAFAENPFKNSLAR